jgi:hypothetical protein
MGLVSKSIRANYLNGQAGLFKLVRVSTRVMRLKEKPDVSTNDEILFPEVEKGSKPLISKIIPSSHIFSLLQLA